MTATTTTTRPTLRVSRLYFTFVNRRVLNVGVLKSPMARWGIAAGALVIYLFMTVLGFFVLRDFVQDDWSLRFIINVSGLSVLLTVFGAFAFVKILFNKAHDLSVMTYQLPVTNRQRIWALTLFEFIMVACGFLFMTSSTMIPIVVLGGWSALRLVVTGLLFPAVIMYLVLATLYALGDRFLAAVGLDRARSLIMTALLAVALLGIVIVTSNQTTSLSAEALGSEQAFVPTRVFTTLDGDVGLVLTTLIFCTAVAALFALLLWALPSVPNRSYKYLAVFPSSRLRMSAFRPYLMYTLRSSETGMALVLSGGLFLVLSLDGALSPMLALGVLIFPAIYTYASVAPLRRLDVSFRNPTTRAAVSHYLKLVGSHMAVVCAVWVIFYAITGVVSGSWFDSMNVIPLGAALLGVLIMLLMGIMFPPERDNPFSVGISIFLVVMFLVLMIIGIGLLQMHWLVNVAIVSATVVSVISFSIYGIWLNARRNYYA